MKEIDIAIAWEWEYDRDWVLVLKSMCEGYGLSFLEIVPGTLQDVRNKVHAGELSINVYLDRAGDILEPFAVFNDELRKSGSFIFNKPGRVTRALDKATMHLEFLTAGIHVPFTVILSPFDKDPELRLSELGRLGRPFIIKPANGGGGLGVVKGAEDLIDVIHARQEYSQDKYLLQQKIIPKCIVNRRAWFRTFYVGGKFTVCWWDDQTHIYEEVLPVEQEAVRWHRLREVTNRIAKVSGLNFFSSEVSIDEKNRITVVDYVNEPCDLRMKSVHPDGIPDKVVIEITEYLLAEVKRRVKKKKKKESI